MFFWLLEVSIVNLCGVCLSAGMRTVKDPHKKFSQSLIKYPLHEEMTASKKSVGLHEAGSPMVHLRKG